MLRVRKRGKEIEQGEMEEGKGKGGKDKRRRCVKSERNGEGKHNGKER